MSNKDKIKESQRAKRPTTARVLFDVSRELSLHAQSMEALAASLSSSPEDVVEGGESGLFLMTRGQQLLNSASLQKLKEELDNIIINQHCMVSKLEGFELPEGEQSPQKSRSSKIK